MGSWRRIEPRLAWYVVFEDRPGAVARIRRDGDLLALFDITLLLGHFEHRRVKAMWLIAECGENGDVIRAYGNVPSAIADRFASAPGKPNPPHR